MDISKETEKIMRNAGFETWSWTQGPVPVVCFENEAVLGFVHVFPSSTELIENWEQSQDATLARFRPALKNAGEKAWNVYSIFLAATTSKNFSTKHLDLVEEDFRLTRKIARGGINSIEGLTNALLPLLPIRNRPEVDEADFDQRLRVSLEEISEAGTKAFFKGARPADIAQILAEEQ